MHSDNRNSVFWRAGLCGLALVAATQAPSAAPIVEDFESYTSGNLPSPVWLDVAAVAAGVPPFINAPLPSATVVTTTNAQGNTTQALQTVDALGLSKGIYTAVPLSSSYSLFADIRTLQFANSNPLAAGPATDWSMQLTFAQAGVENFAYAPQVGVYASSLTQGWRIYLISSNGGPIVDIDLGVAAALNTWYTIGLDLDTTTGTFHSLITDTASGLVLGDATNVIPAWETQFGLFDSIAFFVGEVAAQDPATPESTTIPNIGQVDNINVTTQPVPIPGALGLLAAALLPLLRSARRARAASALPNSTAR